MSILDYRGYEQPNWDGMGAEPISIETQILAEVLVNLLYKRPDDAPGGDGSIGFEWRNDGNILCLDVLNGKISFYGKINGKMFHANKDD